MDFDMSYVIYGLIIAALAIVIIYFSQVEEDEPAIEPEIKKADQLKTQLNDQLNDQLKEQLKTQLNEQIARQEREYGNLLNQVREAENTRRNEYAKQVDQIRNVELQLNREKDMLMKERQEFLEQKIEFEKKVSSAPPKKAGRPRKSK